MTTGAQAYFEKIEEKFLNSDERAKDIHEIIDSEYYKRYLILKDQFKEMEEYIILREKFKKLSESLCYNFNREGGSYG